MTRSCTEWSEVRQWSVNTAEQTVKVRAKSPFDAAVAAVKTAKFKAMGLLMECKAKGIPEHYVSSEKVCKAAGMWRKPTDA